MIEVKNLTKYYGQLAAVKNVSFRVEKGEILGFLGVNAAGKTTTMRILTGYLPASSGKAAVADYDVFEQPLAVKKRVGYLPENVPIYRDMPVQGYLDFVAQCKGMSYRERKKRVPEVMEATGITKIANRLTDKISKGYRQRVGLAQALVNNPEVLILDEPTVGLDPAQIMEIRELIKNLRETHTVILSSHILAEVRMTCERVIIINEGKIVAEGTPEALTTQLEQTRRIRIQVKGPEAEIKECLEKINGVEKIKTFSLVDDINTLEIESSLTLDNRPEIARVLVQKGWDLLDLRTHEMSLEEAFIRLVTRDIHQEKQKTEEEIIEETDSSPEVIEALLASESEEKGGQE